MNNDNRIIAVVDATSNQGGAALRHLVRSVGTFMHVTLVNPKTVIQGPFSEKNSTV